MVFDLEVGGDERWGLTSDPCGEWLSCLSLVIFYYLDRARNGIWVKSFLCRGSRSRRWCGGSVVWLPGIRACIARLRASHLAKCTILLRRVSSLHARLRWRLLHGPRRAWWALWSWRQVVALGHGGGRHLRSGRRGA